MFGFLPNVKWISFFWSSLHDIYVIQVHSSACHVTRGLTDEEIGADSCHVPGVAQHIVEGHICALVPSDNFAFLVKRCVRGKHILCFGRELRSCRMDVRIRFPRFLICRLSSGRMFHPSYDKMTTLRWDWTCLKLVKMHSSITLGNLIFQSGSSYLNLLVMAARAVIKNFSR